MLKMNIVWVFYTRVHLRAVFFSVVASGAGVEACNRCAKGFLMEEWRCVSSCSAGFYATEPTPEIADGHRTCRRWAYWCVFRCGWFVYWLMAGLNLVVGSLALVLAVCCCRAPVWSVGSFFFFLFFLHLCWISVLFSSGATPTVSPVPGRVCRTAAAVPAVIASRRECV